MCTQSQCTPCFPLHGHTPGIVSIYSVYAALAVLLKSVRSGPEPSGAVRTPPGVVPTPPVIQLLNVQKGINRTQITCSLLAQYLHFIMYKTNMEK